MGKKKKMRDRERERERERKSDKLTRVARIACLNSLLSTRMLRAHSARGTRSKRPLVAVTGSDVTLAGVCCLQSCEALLTKAGL